MPLIRKSMTVGMIGDSLFKGRLNTGWDARFEAAARGLPSCLGPFNVCNEGKGSQNSDWGVANIGLIADQRFSHALIEFGVNDSALIGGVPEVSRANFNANITAMVAAVRAARADTVIALLTMNDVNAAGQALRPHLGDQYYADLITLAGTLGVDIIDNYGGSAPWGNHAVAGGWPKPGPDALYQIDPTTGLPDGLHPIASAVDTYLMPNMVAWVAAKQAAYWP